MNASLVVRPYQPGDEHALLALHNRAFDGHAPRSLAHWNWRFRDNPVDRIEIVLASDGAGDALAVYAVMPQRILLDGEPCRAGLQTDLAVDPRLRSGLASGRLIVAVGEEFRRRFHGPEVRLEWGFPEPHLQRVCLRHLGVGVLRDVLFLARECTPLSAPALEVRASHELPSGVEELWARCAPELGTATVRDARYLDWRYVRHPDVRHTLLSAHDTHGELRGLAVVRTGGPHPAALALMDWLVPLADRDAERALLARAVAEAARRDLEGLAAWFPAPWPLFTRLQREHGFFVQGSPYQECYRARDSSLGRRWLDAHWYQTLGDVDFF